MDEFDELAKRYGGAVDRGRGLTKVSMPVQLPVRLDVGFSTSYYGAWLARIFPALRHYDATHGLYVYGDGAGPLSQILAKDGDLCSAIRLVLDRYAFELECSDSRVTARINTVARPFSLDPSGGVDLLSGLTLIQRGLAELDYRGCSAGTKGMLALGPARFRKIFTAGIVLAIFSVAILLPHVASRPGSHTSLRQ